MPAYEVHWREAAMTLFPGVIDQILIMSCRIIWSSYTSLPRKILLKQCFTAYKLHISILLSKLQEVSSTLQHYQLSFVIQFVFGGLFQPNSSSFQGSPTGILQDCTVYDTATHHSFNLYEFLFEIIAYCNHNYTSFKRKNKKSNQCNIDYLF